MGTTLTVNVLPNDGTCLVRITDVESGEALEHETGRNEFTLTARVER